MSGTVGGSGVRSTGGSVLGGLGVVTGTGNSLSTMSGLNGISPVWRKAERMDGSSLEFLFANGAQHCEELEAPLPPVHDVAQYLHNQLS